MTTPLARQRCWNHAAREAACRCPACSRFFCRECVTEHDARLLCAACVAGMAKTARRTSTRWRSLVARGAVAAGLLLAWATFYSTGSLISQINARFEEPWWLAP